MAVVKKKKKRTCWQGCGEMRAPVLCWWDVKSCSSGKPNVRSAKNKNQKYHVIQWFHFWVYTQKNRKQGLKQVFVLHVHGSIIHSSWMVEVTQVTIHSSMDKKKICPLHAVVYSLASKRKQLVTQATTWGNLEDIMLSELSQTQRTNTGWVHLNEVPGMVSFMETESRVEVARTGGWGGEEVLVLNRCRGSVWEDEDVLGMEGQDSSTTVWLYSMPLNFTLNTHEDGKFCYVHFTPIKEKVRREASAVTNPFGTACAAGAEPFQELCRQQTGTSE